jgi:hypothetical protein
VWYREDRAVLGRCENISIWEHASRSQPQLSLSDSHLPISKPWRSLPTGAKIERTAIRFGTAEKNMRFRLPSVFSLLLVLSVELAAQRSPGVLEARRGEQLHHGYELRTRGRRVGYRNSSRNAERRSEPMFPCCSPPPTVLAPRNCSLTSGHWRSRLKPLRQSAPPTTWPSATGTRLQGGTHRWENRRTSALEQENEEEMEDPHRTAYHEAGLLTG